MPHGDKPKYLLRQSAWAGAAMALFLFAASDAARASPANDQILSELRCQREPSPASTILHFLKSGLIRLNEMRGADSVSCWAFRRPYDLAGLAITGVCGAEENERTRSRYPGMFWRGPGTSPGTLLSVLTVQDEHDIKNWRERHALTDARVSKNDVFSTMAEVSCNSEWSAADNVAAEKATRRDGAPKPSDDDNRAERSRESEKRSVDRYQQMLAERERSVRLLKESSEVGSRVQKPTAELAASDNVAAEKATRRDGAPKPSDDDNRAERSRESEKRSVDRYQQMLAERERSAQLSAEQFELQRQFEKEIAELPSVRDEVQNYCAGVQQKAPTSDMRALLAAACHNKLRNIAFRDREILEREESKARWERKREDLKALQKQLDSLPVNLASLAHLKELYRTTRDFDESALVQSSQSAMGEALAKKRCQPYLVKANLPAALKEAVIINGVAGGQSAALFICGAVLTVGQVEIASMPGDALRVRIADFTLTFAVGRYHAEQQQFVSASSPLKGGTNAIRLIDATKGGQRLALDNPGFFIINFDAQFTGSLAQLLSEPD